jgi:ABC-type branched-subunit amino acid transport system substrate-binding protein
MHRTTRYFSFSWYFNQCDESLSAGYTSRLIYQNDVSAIMGPVCPETSFVTGAITSFKKIPTFLWGPTAPADFYTREKYTTTMPFAGTARGMFVALSNIMAQFNVS